MKPSIEAGDYMIVHKGAALARGDVITFNDPQSRTGVMVFRLIGLPGDRIALRDGLVFLNDDALPQSPEEDDEQVYAPEGNWKTMPVCFPPVVLGETCTIARFTENLPEGRSWQILDLRSAGDGVLDDVGPFAVPPGHVFVLGDNRDNAADSRLSVPEGGRGMIPAERILGPVVRVVPR